jgi:NitT/TauT family transport system ATP-binding protein
VQDLPSAPQEVRTNLDLESGAAVSMRDVSKVYSGGTVALSGFSLNVMPGEFVTLLGPSGCGKSTALRIIAGLAEPSAGTVRRAGDGADRHDGAIGFVFQEPTLMPWATVFDNVMLPLKLQHAPASARSRVMEALEAVGLANFSAAYPRELSGGMKMRVSIARALVTKPKLLLMDEPFAALDEITRHKLNDDVLALWGKADVTIVFVTHSIFESAYLSSRIVVMTPRPGRVHSELVLDHRNDVRDADYRTSESYRDITSRVSRALRSSVGEPE